MATYPLISERDMFRVSEFDKTGELYIVRTPGWNEKSGDNYYVCEGGLLGRPHSGPFKTPEEAEDCLKRNT